ncbi:MAG TPA: 2-C-methyl-D-erythritol 4-phosphate cytidylyltransferase [Acidimicrobiales bacterium]
MEIWAIVVAAGSSTRFGRPKQFADLAGRPVLHWSVEAARAACGGIVVVLPAADAAVEVPGADAVQVGGLTRSDSVRAGLAAVPAATEIIVVHDAARPLAPPALWSAVVAEIKAGADAAIPGVAVTDTIKRVSATGSIETLDRSQLVAVQTPQAFRASALRAAHAGAAHATDDAALIEAAGGRVVVVAGDPDNLKLTGPGDLEVLALLLTRSRVTGGAP